MNPPWCTKKHSASASDPQDAELAASPAPRDGERHGVSSLVAAKQQAATPPPP